MLGQAPRVHTSDKLVESVRTWTPFTAMTIKPIDSSEDLVLYEYLFFEGRGLYGLQ